MSGDIDFLPFLYWCMEQELADFPFNNSFLRYTLDASQNTSFTGGKLKLIYQNGKLIR